MKPFANFLIFAGFAILLIIFFPVLKQEITYRSEKFAEIEHSLTVDDSLSDGKVKKIIPVDTEFGIIIPKINVNAKIFPNVDFYNEKEYLPVLKKGVAHAKGTGFPGEGKNIFLFAHSTDSFFNFHQYNAIFYLIGKLEKGDEIDIYYQQKLFRYYVSEKFVVSPIASQDYLKPKNKEILILQTCYPPETTLKRLIVIANNGID